MVHPLILNVLNLLYIMHLISRILYLNNNDNNNNNNITINDIIMKNNNHYYSFLQHTHTHIMCRPGPLLLYCQCTGPDDHNKFYQNINTNVLKHLDGSWSCFLKEIMFMFFMVNKS